MSAVAYPRLVDFLEAVVPPTMSRYRLVARPLGHGGKKERTFGVQDASSASAPASWYSCGASVWLAAHAIYRVTK
jgi:hypothetical protein